MDFKAHFRAVLSRSGVNARVVDHKYVGSGTEQDPYQVEWLPNDERDPTNMGPVRQWLMAMVTAVATLAVTFASAAFSGAIPQIQEYFQVEQTLSTLSVSLFVLGFALGPMLWAPVSELYGRQYVWHATLSLCTIFGAGSCGSKNIATLLVLRFLSGSFGASLVVNGAGIVADIFPSAQRGLAILIWSVAPFIGPAIAPICGGFLAATSGWKWVDGLTAAFCGFGWIIGTVLIPETYAPVILERRAVELSKMTGMVYKSKLELGRGTKTAREVFSVTLQRPWIILAVEPIALLLAVYVAIVYGTLYLIFSAFPIAFREERGWSQAISSLTFIGILVGQLSGMLAAYFLDKRYRNNLKKPGWVATPEQRLIPCLIGAVTMPVGLFWFAFTTYPSVHWIVSLIGSSFFGFGQVLVFISVISYLIDAYTIYAASALASNAILRALFGFAFPLFTTQMYHNLGVQWASSIPAFLALVCLPFPFLFHKYGPAIRKRCKYSAESQRLNDALLAKRPNTRPPSIEEKTKGPEKA